MAAFLSLHECNLYQNRIVSAFSAALLIPAADLHFFLHFTVPICLFLCSHHQDVHPSCHMHFFFWILTHSGIECSVSPVVIFLFFFLSTFISSSHSHHTNRDTCTVSISVYTSLRSSLSNWASGVMICSSAVFSYAIKWLRADVGGRSEHGSPTPLLHQSRKHPPLFPYYLPHPLTLDNLTLPCAIFRKIKLLHEQLLHCILFHEKGHRVKSIANWTVRYTSGCHFFINSWQWMQL